MATPLVQLLRDMIDDPAVRAEFAEGPMDYLGRHGYESLDAADVREALMIMADGAPTSEAVQLHAGGEAIDPDTGNGLAGAAAGLGSAMGAMATADVDTDPADLDGLGDTGAGEESDDGAENTAPGDERGTGTDNDDDDADRDEPGDAPEGDAVETAASTESLLSEVAVPETDDVVLDVDEIPDGGSVEAVIDSEPSVDTESFAPPPDTSSTDVDGPDDWGDVI